MSLVLNRSYDESNSTGTKLSVTLATSLKTSQESTERQVSTTIEGIANLSFSETTSTSYTHVSITTHSVTLVPSSIENKFWKMFFQKLDVSQYKDNPKALSVAVETMLNNFSKQLETRNLPSYNLVVKYAKELRNKSLEEIINKYFESSSTKGKHPYIEDLIVLFKGFETEVFSISKLLEIETGILKESIINSLSPGAINRDALMRLLAAKKKEKHPKLDCYVIDQSDFQDLLTHVSKLKSSNQNTRFQLLIRTDVHYTAADIEIKHSRIRAAVMDAAGDKSSSVLVQQLKLNGADEIYQLGAMDRIQYDFHNCAYFSLDSVVKSSQDPNFFELLKLRSKVDKEGINHVEWSNMPPKFVKNASSSQFVDKYCDQHQESVTELYKKSKTFKQFIESNKEIREVKPNTLRTTNVTIEKKIGKYTQIATNLLLSLNNNDFSRLTKTYPINQFIANHPIIAQ